MSDSLRPHEQQPTWLLCPWNSLGKNTEVDCHFPAGQGRRHKRLRFNPWVWKIPWRRAWQPIPVFLPGKFDGQRSLEDYNPQGHKESDMTEATELAWTLEDIHRLTTCVLVSRDQCYTTMSAYSCRQTGCYTCLWVMEPAIIWLV